MPAVVTQRDIRQTQQADRRLKLGPCPIHWLVGILVFPATYGKGVTALSNLVGCFLYNTPQIKSVKLYTKFTVLRDITPGFMIVRNPAKLLMKNALKLSKLLFSMKACIRGNVCRYSSHHSPMGTKCPNWTAVASIAGRIDCCSTQRWS